MTVDADGAPSQPNAKKKFLRVLLLVTPALVSLSPLIPSLMQGRLPAPLFAPVVAVLVLLLSLGVEGVRRSDSGRFVVVSLAVAAVITTLTGAIALAWAPSLGNALKEMLAVSVSLWAAWAFARALPVASEMLRWSLRGWSAAWVLVLLGAVLEWFGGSPILHDTQSFLAYENHIDTTASYTYVASFLGNPNDLAGFLLTTTPLVLSMSLLGSHRRAYGLVVLLFAIMCVWTGSRTAIGALIPFLLVMIMCKPRGESRSRSRRMATVGATIGGLAVVTLALVISGWADRGAHILFAPFADNGSAQDQARATWSAWALDQTLNNHFVLGAGPGSFEYLAGPIGFTSNLHDSLLELGFQYGLVAMITVVTALGVVVVTGLRASMAQVEPISRSLGALAVLSVSGLLLWSFTSSSILMNGFWGIALGNAAALAIVASRTTRRRTVSLTVDASPDVIGGVLRDRGATSVPSESAPVR